MKRLLIIALAAASIGCGIIPWDRVPWDKLPDDVTIPLPKPPEPPEAPADGFPAGLVWLHTNVSGWPQTSTIERVYFSGGNIHFPHSMSGKWDARTDMGTSTLTEGNPWAIFEYEGQWYAATWEWLRPGQTSKPASKLEGGHIKRNPIPSSWRPSSGQRIGIMVSTHARARVGRKERSNVAWIDWP